MRLQGSGQLRIIKSIKHTGPKPPNEADILSSLQNTHPTLSDSTLRFRHLTIEHRCCSSKPQAEISGVNAAASSSWARSIPKIFALHVLVSLGEALAWLHHGLVPSGHRRYERASDHGPILHRDIKPDNVLPRFDGATPGLPTLVLADFGLSCLASNAKPRTGCVAFMAPVYLWETTLQVTNKPTYTASGRLS